MPSKTRQIFPIVFKITQNSTSDALRLSVCPSVLTLKTKRYGFQIQL